MIVKPYITFAKLGENKWGTKISRCNFILSTELPVTVHEVKSPVNKYLLSKQRQTVLRRRARWTDIWQGLHKQYRINLLL